jgi:hypothetical protein
VLNLPYGFLVPDRSGADRRKGRLQVGPSPAELRLVKQVPHRAKTSGRAIIRGSAAGRIFDFEAEIVGLSDREAYLVTNSEPVHKAKLQVRHQGAIPGGRPSTTCAFEWDGAYISMATYKVADDGTVIIQPEDY